VNIPIALHSAVRKDEIKFRLLRKTDESPVVYKRVAEVDGQEVPWPDIVKGYEYEKGRFVIVDEKDLKNVDVESTRSIQILDFVKLQQIDPIYFDKPYYLEPLKGGAHAYALLRDVMVESGTIGIAKVVMKTKQHLGAVKPREGYLVLELMHFADEVLKPEGLASPAASVGKTKEFELAKALVGQMTADWDPAKYNDDYKSSLLKVIEDKIKSGGKAAKRRPVQAGVPSNVLDMVETLEKSLSETKTGKASKGKPTKKHKAAA